MTREQAPYFVSIKRAAYRAIRSISRFILSPLLARAERGHRKRVRDDQNREGVGGDLVDGERDAIERDRALGGDEAHQIARRAQGQPRHVGQVLARDKLGDAIDMAGDDMAAQFVAHLQGAFEIEPGARRPCAGRRHAQRFGGGIDRKERAAALFAGLDHREADAGMRDRSADGDTGAGIGAGDLQPAQAFGLRLDRNDLAHIGGDAREHF